MCTKWASTDEGGEGATNCLYEVTGSTMKV